MTQQYDEHHDGNKAHLILYIVLAGTSHNGRIIKNYTCFSYFAMEKKKKKKEKKGISSELFE